MAEFENGSAVLGSNPVNSDTGILNHDCSKMDEHGTSGHMLPSIFDVVKSGMLIPVQTYIENMGVEVLKSRDDQGHTPAHWSCLGGHATILRYIIEMKGPVDQPSENDLGQRPIHWACVNGHIAIVDILLQAGATLDVTDHKGCTPLIVACQYGQTMLSGYLIGKGARTQMKDKDGDTALHWAAFKGHSELLRLLIYSGFNPHQKDNYGQTALHLSCINGNLTSVIELIELEKVEINDEDHNGKTPLMLAAGRKHHMIVTYLNKQTKARASLLPKIDLWTIVFGPPGNHKGPLMFFIVSMLFWAYPMYIFKCLPVTWYELETLHVIFMFFNVIMWIALYHAATTNPGFIPRNIPEYDRAIKQVAHFDEWKQGKNPLSRLCHTCRTVKPMRSKHCRICNRCVRLMDHHCPYIYNCVGENNRVSFVMFTTCSGLSGLITLYFILYMWNIEGTKFYYPFAIIEATFFEGLAVFVALNSVYQMLLNLTTNERSNWHRYKYLQDGKGQYFNAYDRGWKNNILEFLFLKKPLSDDEIEFLNVTVV